MAEFMVSVLLTPPSARERFSFALPIECLTIVRFLTVTIVNHGTPLKMSPSTT
jgi:hypothetical protein